METQKSVHENYRPYQCDMCDKAFFLKREKVKHMINVHKTEEKIIEQSNFN